MDPSSAQARPGVPGAGKEAEHRDHVSVSMESGSAKARQAIRMPNLPRSLTLEEKRYLLAVERGDIAAVRKMVQRAERTRSLNVNCVDPLGRGALSLAIDSENFAMVQLLVVLGVATGDALLLAIDTGFVEAVELLLEHEELVHKDGEPYSWEKVDRNVAMFTPDITPLVLAAHRNNYEILKILLDRGATLPMPHDVKCGCDACLRELREDSLRHSATRLSEYRALASSSLMALSSSDPLLTAFQLSWELRDLATAEAESRTEYLELRRQCQQFAVDILHQVRSSTELAAILNHDPSNPPEQDGESMKLARLELAIIYKQKKFVAHPKVQQLLANLWYDGLPGFRRKRALGKLLDLVQIALLFPLYCAVYMIAPHSPLGRLARKPFIKFLVHASSYLFFLLIIILVSQRVDVKLMALLGSPELEERQRGNPPSPLEWVVLVYVLGFIWEETAEMLREGMRRYLRNMWNFIDFSRNSLYVLCFVFRGVAFFQQRAEVAADPQSAYVPRERWPDFDPQLVGDGMFAAANILSALKLVHLFSINPHLGPLQISLGRMVNDIVKFLFIYSLVLFAFACGMNQLLWYFSELERRKCYSLPNGQPNWDENADSCSKWRSFANLFEASQSLFWASFGNVGIDSFELTGINQYTRFWGLLMFGSYSVINVIVLLNLLIAMMSNSYAMIEERADTEWKFARTRLWMSYFEEGATVPPPFNIFPTFKRILRVFRPKSGVRRLSTKSRDRVERERDFRYSAVMRALVWRYISASHRACIEAPVTEDDVNELKADVSSLRCDLLEVLSRNGMDVGSVQAEDKNAPGNRRMRVWERRLLKDFHVAPVAAADEEPLLMAPPPENETGLQRFRRVAKLAVMQASTVRWRQVVQGVCRASQIGSCHSRESFMSQQNLQRAMEEARKLVERDKSGGSSPMPPYLASSRNLLDLLREDRDEPRSSREDRQALLRCSASPNELVPLKAGRAGGFNSPPRVVKRKPQQSTVSVEPAPLQLGVPTPPTPSEAVVAAVREASGSPDQLVVPQDRTCSPVLWRPSPASSSPPLSPIERNAVSDGGDLVLEVGRDVPAQPCPACSSPRPWNPSPRVMSSRVTSPSLDAGPNSYVVHEAARRPGTPEFLRHPILQRRNASPNLFAEMTVDDMKRASLSSWRSQEDEYPAPDPGWEQHEDLVHDVYERRSSSSTQGDNDDDSNERSPGLDNVDGVTAVIASSSTSPIDSDDVLPLAVESASLAVASPSQSDAGHDLQELLQVPTVDGRSTPPAVVALRNAAVKPVRREARAGAWL